MMTSGSTPLDERRDMAPPSSKWHLTSLSLLLLFTPIEALADDTLTPTTPTDAVEGHLGLGYFTDLAPLGVRYWWTPELALDVGIDAALTSGATDAWRAGGELGLVYAISSYHYCVVIARGGLGFRATDARGEQETGMRFDTQLSAFVGAELFMGAFGFPNVSLQGGYGLSATWIHQGGTELVLGITDAGLNMLGAARLGFHIYL